MGPDAKNRHFVIYTILQILLEYKGFPPPRTTGPGQNEATAGIEEGEPV